MILLSDGYLANGSEPWQLPDVDALPGSTPRSPPSRTTTDDGDKEFWPYLRDPETLARPWAVPGTPGAGAPHRRAGEGRRDGNISYDPANHDFMVRTRQAKVDGDRRVTRRSRSTTPTAPPACSCSAGDRPTARSAPPAAGCASRARRSPRRICATSTRSRQPRRGAAQLRAGVVPEMNLGQLAMLLRARYPRRRRGVQPGARAAVHAPAELVDAIIDDVIEESSDDQHRTALARPADVPPPTCRRPARTSRPTRRCAGARAAVTTPSWPPCRASCPSSGCAREHRVHLGHRLLVAVPVLPRTPTACTRSTAARRRSRPGWRTAASGPVGVGRHRRRRRAVDRRQPPDPRAAPQRQPEDPAVQQPDLRADQGPVLADVRAGQGHEVHADGLGGHAVQPGLAGAGRGGDVRRADAGHRPQAPDRGAARGRRAPRHRRWSRSTRTARSSTTAHSTCSRTRRPGTSR